MTSPTSRRTFLGAIATAASTGLAGCGSPGSVFGSESEETEVDGSGTGRESSELDASDRATPSGRYADVYDAVSPSVASVSVYRADGRAGQGSAFVYDEGHVVTNEHVVAGAETVYVRFETTGWKSASVVATDVYSDLAVLDVDTLPSDATPLSFVERDPAVGTEVVAIGNPYGYSGSVSAGIVSGVNRTLPAANGFSIADAIQTDAAVNPGNSGGPLVTLDGDVVGVVNAGGGDNIGFAISAALTKRVVPELLADGEYGHSYMGVTLSPVSPTIARANEISTAQGVYIDRVIEGSPSDGVFQGTTETQTIDGIETPVGGDVVTRMDDTPIPTRQMLSSFLALETRPGDSIDVRVLRDGEPKTVELELGSRPEPNR